MKPLHVTHLSLLLEEEIQTAILRYCLRPSSHSLMELKDEIMHKLIHCFHVKGKVFHPESPYFSIEGG